MVSNVSIYGLNDSVIASGYAKRTEVSLKTTVMHKDLNRACSLGKTPYWVWARSVLDRNSSTI